MMIDYLVQIAAAFGRTVKSLSSVAGARDSVPIQLRDSADGTAFDIWDKDPGQ
jgi:hypothetical protein